MTYSKAFCQLKPFIPWVFTSIALGYAAYLHYNLKKINGSKKKTQMNPDKLDGRHEVNIDTIDRNCKKKRVSYCRCWKSETFPLCDGAHKCHNRENDDKTGPLVLVWNEEDSQQVSPKSIPESMSPIDQDMDIKSFDSESPILQSSNGDSNGEFEKMDKMNESTMNISDEQLSSMEMIENEYDDEVTLRDSAPTRPQQ